MTTAIVLIIVSLAFGAMTLRAMRKHELREQIALLWVLVTLVMVVLSITFPFHVLDHIAHAVGIKYGTDLLFFLAFLFMVVLVFSMSIAVTRLNARTTRLAQELAMLNERHSAPEALSPDAPDGSAEQDDPASSQAAETPSSQDPQVTETTTARSDPPRPGSAGTAP